MPRSSVVLLWLAEVFSALVLGQTQAAQSPECQAALSAKTPDSTEAAQRLLDCGEQAFSRDEYNNALQVLEQARQMAARLQDRARLASALWRSADILVRLGNASRAEPAVTESLRLREELQDKKGMAQSWTTMGGLWRLRGDFSRARECHLQCLKLSQEIGNREGVAFALNNIGASYDTQGDSVRALEYYERSLSELERLGDKRRAARVMINVGWMYGNLGDYGRSLELYRQAMGISQQLGDRFRVADAWDALGNVHLTLSDYAAALEAMQKGLEIRASLAVASASESLHAIALAYKAQGTHAQALEYFHKSLASARQHGNQSLLAKIHSDMGDLFLLEGKTSLALEALRKSLGLARSLGLKADQQSTLNRLGRLYLSRRRFDAAADCFAESLRLSEAASNRQLLAETLTGMSELAYYRKDVGRSLELASRAALIAETSGLADLRWRALTQVGRAERALGRPEIARQAFDAAIALIEDLRTRVAGGEENRSRYFSDKLTPYHERIALALASSQPGEALYFAERSKSRTLLDATGADRAPAVRTMSQEERRKDRQFRNTLASFNSQIRFAGQQAEPDNARLATLRQQREAVRLEYEAFQTSLYASHPELRIRRADIPVLRPEEASTLLPGPSSIALEFVATPQLTWVFAVTASGITAHRLNLAGPELASSVEQFRRQLAARDLRAPETARHLFNAVLGPVRPLLAGKTELILVPDGVLWDLPFQALQPAANRYLIEDHAISYSPSLTVLRESVRARPRRAMGTGELLAFGNPALGPEVRRRSKVVLMGETLEPLPEAEKQVKLLPAIYGPSSRVFTGVEAHEARWKSEAGRYRILHLAAHGVLDNHSPLYSHIVLADSGPGASEDGLLEAWEIMEMDLAADLVVLSACETARGRISAGEGVIGLMWALFVAGSPATLVSQWKVESASSTALMVEFHRQWRAGGNGLSKAESLREASLRLLRNPEYSHPFYWAGYILVGDSR